MMPGEGSGEFVGATQRLPTFLTRHHLAGGGMYAKKRGLIYLFVILAPRQPETRNSQSSRLSYCLDWARFPAEASFSLPWTSFQSWSQESTSYRRVIGKLAGRRYSKRLS